MGETHVVFQIMCETRWYSLNKLSMSVYGLLEPITEVCKKKSSIQFITKYIKPYQRNCL